MFGGELEVPVEPDYSRRSKARRQTGGLYGMLQRQVEYLFRIVEMVHAFCRTENYMFQPIKKGIAGVSHEAVQLRVHTESD